MKLPESLAKISVPLSLLASVGAALFVAWTFFEARYVQAGDFKRFVQEVRVNTLEDKKAALEREVFRLELKKRVYPKQFDKVDEAYLDRSKEDLKEVNTRIRQIQAAVRGN